MNVYYNIDDLDLSDGPVIVNMIIERANGQQIVSSLAPDAVVEEFNIQGLVDSAEVLREEVKGLVTDLEWVKGANLRLTAELEECRRVRDQHYHNLKSAREKKASLVEERDSLSLELRHYKLAFEDLKGAYKAVCRERDELKAERADEEKYIRSES